MPKDFETRCHVALRDAWGVTVDGLSGRQTLRPFLNKRKGRFHLSGYLNGAVDKTRRAENKRLRAQQPTDESLKGTKYLWLRSPESREEKHEQELSELCGRPEKLATVQAWELKEQFREFFACATREAAEQFFGDWRQRVSKQRGRQMVGGSLGAGR